MQNYMESLTHLFFSTLSNLNIAFVIHENPVTFLYLNKFPLDLHRMNEMSLLISFSLAQNNTRKGKEMRSR